MENSILITDPRLFALLLTIVGIVSVACEGPSEPPAPPVERDDDDLGRLEVLEQENRALFEEIERLRRDLALESRTRTTPAPVPAFVSGAELEPDGPEEGAANEEVLRDEVERLRRSLAELEVFFEALGASYERSEEERGLLEERIDLLLGREDGGR